MGDLGERARDDPLTGWRYWQVSQSGWMRSVTQRRIEWRPGHVLRAGCLGGGHRAPDDTCDCGIHGARDLDTLREHGLCLAPEALVVGQVALWGKVCDDESGYRAEYAVPARLWLVPELVLEEEVDAFLARLGAYAVSVATMALTDAVAGVSAATLAFQAMSARASRTLGS